MDLGAVYEGGVEGAWRGRRSWVVVVGWEVVSGRISAWRMEDGGDEAGGVRAVLRGELLGETVCMSS